MESIEHSSSFEADSPRIGLETDSTLPSTIGFTTYHKIRNAEQVVYVSDNQEVILRRPTVSPSNAITIGLGDRFQVGTDFTLLGSNSQTVFVRKFSDDLIGIALTANTDPVFFKTGDNLTNYDNFEYSI